MRQAAKKLNKANMLRATEQAKRRVKEWIELAEEASKDTRKALRLEICECKACFYSSRIGGNVITTRACAICGRDRTYESSATDVLCLGCATENKLCAHCGGDLEMRVRRKDWPGEGR